MGTGYLSIAIRQLQGHPAELKEVYALMTDFVLRAKKAPGLHPCPAFRALCDDEISESELDEDDLTPINFYFSSEHFAAFCRVACGAHLRASNYVASPSGMAIAKWGVSEEAFTFETEVPNRAISADGKSLSKVTPISPAELTAPKTKKKAKEEKQRKKAKKQGQLMRMMLLAPPRKPRSLPRSQLAPRPWTSTRPNKKRRMKRRRTRTTRRSRSPR